MLTLMLTLIYLLPLLRFDLFVMLTFRSKLHLSLGREGRKAEIAEVTMVFAVLM